MPLFLFILKVLANLINTRKKILRMRRPNVHQMSNALLSDTKTHAVSPTEDMMSLKLSFGKPDSSSKERIRLEIGSGSQKHRSDI